MKTKPQKYFYTHLREVGFTKRFEFRLIRTPLGDERHYVLHTASRTPPFTITQSEFAFLQKKFSTHGNLYGWIKAVLPTQDSRLYHECLGKHLKK